MCACVPGFVCVGVSVCVLVRAHLCIRKRLESGNNRQSKRLKRGINMQEDEKYLQQKKEVRLSVLVCVHVCRAFCVLVRVCVCLCARSLMQSQKAANQQQAAKQKAEKRN